jgi:hypothetical protein
MLRMVNPDFELTGEACTTAPGRDADTVTFPSVTASLTRDGMFQVDSSAHAHPDRHGGKGIEHCRRPLRQPEQAQRVEFDLTVEAHDAHKRDDPARRLPGRLPSVQLRVCHRRADVQRRDLPKHRNAGTAGATCCPSSATSCPFSSAPPPGDAAILMPIDLGTRTHQARGPPETLHEGQIEGECVAIRPRAHQARQADLRPAAGPV